MCVYDKRGIANFVNDPFRLPLIEKPWRSRERQCSLPNYQSWGIDGPKAPARERSSMPPLSYELEKKRNCTHVFDML